MPINFKAMAAVLGVFTLLGCGGAWAVGSMLTRSTNSDVPLPPAPAQFVQIDSSASIRLAGSYWAANTPDAPAVLLLHGNGASRASMNHTATWLNDKGYAVLAVDFRGHGQSSPAPKSFGLFEADDAHAALAWLRSRNPGVRVGVIGLSLGGAASLLGKAGPLPADAMVLEAVYPDIRRAIYNRLVGQLGSAPATFIEPLLSYQSLPRMGVWPGDISPVRALAGVKAPVMVVGGERDSNTPVAETRTMFAAVSEQRELHILPGLGHAEVGQDMTDAFRASLLRFLDRNLRTARSAP